jgi:signal transduction histidine kinase
VLVDHNAVITAGTLLTRTAVGQAVARTGLVAALQQGKPAILPVGPGLTTPLPTADVMFPVAGAGGTGGGLIIETPVSPDSLFNQSVTALRRGHTVVYSFIDSNGVVVASSDTATLGQPAARDLLDPRFGFRRHGSDVLVAQPVPTAGWRVVFKESSREFEGALTRPLRSALLLIVLAALIGGGLTFFALLARLRASREEQRRLRSINDAREEFISIVSHELRTPATGQLGFLETTLDHWDRLEEGERKAALAHALTNARRLHALTRDILSTASIEAGEVPYVFEVIDLRPVLTSSAEALAPGPNIDVNVPQEACAVRADRGRLEQVMANLLDNAIKNSPLERAISVTLRITPDGEALVEVTDRGTGMTDEQAGRAFEKFARGRDTGVEGTGLGLYICRRIVEAHGGRIWVAVSGAPGTTISFTLPLAPATVSERDATASSAPGSR